MIFTLSHMTVARALWKLDALSVWILLGYPKYGTMSSNRESAIAWVVADLRDDGKLHQRVHPYNRIVKSV